MRNIKIVSGNIDNIKIGANSQADARFLNIESGSSGTGRTVTFHGTNVERSL